MIQDAIDKICKREDLTALESKDLFDLIFGGKVEPDQIKILLLALAEKGESADEILGAARSMRANMIPFFAPENTIDIVGTGGDKLGTLNISTATALLVAACFVPVAKHGNRAASSLSGSSDVLAALGINLEPSWETLEKCMKELGIVFLFAPRHHPAIRHVAAIRRELGIRTIFNFLGPLTNPANVKRHLIGVSSETFLEPLAYVLRELGSEKAWLANSAEGMDEITTTSPTKILMMTPQTSTARGVTPEELGLPRADLAALKGGDAHYNAEAMRALFDGAKNAYRDVVCLNAAAALVVADKVATLAEGLSLAEAALDKGRARQKLDDLIKLTNEKS
jgi:anthranilate phosphoribosyltransferase